MRAWSATNSSPAATAEAPQPAQHGALSLNTAPSRADRSTRPPRPPRSLSESPGRTHSPQGPRARPPRPERRPEHPGRPDCPSRPGQVTHPLCASLHPGRALFEKLYRMRPSFAFIDDEVRAYTICTCQARAMPVPCPHHARTMPAPGPRVHERARLCVPHLLVQLAGRGWQAAAAVRRDHCVAGPGVRDQCALVARVVSASRRLFSLYFN